MAERSRILAMTLTLMLTACGGSGGGTAPITVVAGPPPVATAPAVTPTPAPTPAPPVTNGMAGYGKPCDDFASNITSFAISANIMISRDFGSSTTPDAYVYSAAQTDLADYTDGVTFSFDAKSRATSTTGFTTRGFNYAAYSFAAADVTDVQSTQITYRDANRSLVVTCDAGSAMSFQRYSSDLANPVVSTISTIYRSQIAGVPTAKTSELASGRYASNLTLQAFRTFTLDPAKRTETLVSTAPGQLSYDLASGKITGTITVGGKEPFDLVVDALIWPGLTRLTGTVTASNGAKGDIIGGFYGTNARQLGYVTTFKKDGVYYVGSGSGARQ